MDNTQLIALIVGLMVAIGGPGIAFVRKGLDRIEDGVDRVVAAHETTRVVVVQLRDTMIQVKAALDDRAVVRAMTDPATGPVSSATNLDRANGAR